MILDDRTGRGSRRRQTTAQNRQSDGQKRVVQRALSSGTNSPSNKGFRRMKKIYSLLYFLVNSGAPVTSVTRL
jgi:hypothetical protein